MAKADTSETATPQASFELLSLPPVAIEHTLRSASFSGAIAACACRALRDAWRGLASSNPEAAATALVDRFQTVDAAAEHLYKTELELLTGPLVKSNIAAPAPGLVDAVASPILFIRSALLRKRPPVPTLGYLTGTGASDAHALGLLRHLSSLRESAGREANPAAVSQANYDGGGENAVSDGTVAGQEQPACTVTPFPSSVNIGAAFAGHEATVVELLRHGADPVDVLPGAVRAGNARLCAALLEGGRMAGAASCWSTAAGGDVHGIRGNPSGFVDSYAGSIKATFHVGYINRALLPLACIGRPPGLAGDKGGVRCSSGGGGGGSRSSSGRTRGSVGSTSGVYALGNSAGGLLQRAVGGGCSGGAGEEQPTEDVAAALAAARAAAEKAADTALGGSNPTLQLFVQSSDAAEAAVAAAATAAALAALTPPEASCGGRSSSSGGGGGGGSRAHTPGPACASLSPTTNHAAVRQLLLQWRPAEWQAPPPRNRAAALPHAAAVGAWPAVSELLRAGVDPLDTVAPATVLYLALVQGRGAMAAWLLVRLLAHPAGVWKDIVGVAFAALVTRVMGIASPLQLMLHYKPVSSLEWVLGRIGRTVVYLWAGRILPYMFLPKAMCDLPLSLYTVWEFWPRRQ